MEYATPRDISFQFSTSLQTVYNYLKKPWISIRTKREWGKTYVHIEDFKEAFQASFKTFENPFEKHKKVETDSNFKNLKDDFKSVENEKAALLQENQTLTKRNSSLEEQVTKYAIRFKEEKAEKKQLIASFESKEKEWSEKIDTSQKELRQRIEGFGKERIKRAKKYYLAIGVCVVLLVVTLVLAYPTLRTYFG